MGQPLRVLIVDDSRFTRTVLKKHLMKHSPGVEVVEAGDGEEALALAGSAGPFDLITLDIHMPKVDGLTTAERLVAAGTAAYMTIFSANIQQAAQNRAAELGVGFVAKPVSEAKVIEILGRVAAAA